MTIKLSYKCFHSAPQHRRNDTNLWELGPRPLHCTVLYCTTLHCTALHFTVLHCSTITALNRTTLFCTLLCCTAPYCTLCTALQGTALLHRTVHCITIHCTALNSTALHLTALQCSREGQAISIARPRGPLTTIRARSKGPPNYNSRVTGKPSEPYQTSHIWSQLLGRDWHHRTQAGNSVNSSPQTD